MEPVDELTLEQSVCIRNMPYINFISKHTHKHTQTQTTVLWPLYMSTCVR